MKKLHFIRLVMLAGLISLSAPVWAASSPRTYVSFKGADTSGCQVTYPCLTINYALTQTTAGGEVIVVDSASFAPMTITKSVTVETAPGVYAGITSSGPAGAVTVNPGAGGIVILRGLTIQGAGAMADGIDFNSGDALRVENCALSGALGLSIGINQATGSDLFVKDTVVRNWSNGIAIAPGMQAHEALSHVSLVDNQIGLAPDGGTVSIADSVISKSSIYGIGAFQSSEVNVESCLITNNPGYGIISGGSATVRVSNSTVTGNSTGLYLSTGNLLSRGNNTVEGNTTNGAFTGSYSAK